MPSKLYVRLMPTEKCGEASQQTRDLGSNLDKAVDAERLFEHTCQR